MKECKSKELLTVIHVLRFKKKQETILMQRQFTNVNGKSKLSPSMSVALPDKTIALLDTVTLGYRAWSCEQTDSERMMTKDGQGCCQAPS